MRVFKFGDWEEVKSEQANVHSCCVMTFVNEYLLLENKTIKYFFTKV